MKFLIDREKIRWTGENGKDPCILSPNLWLLDICLW